MPAKSEGNSEMVFGHSHSVQVRSVCRHALFSGLAKMPCASDPTLMVTS